MKKESNKRWRDANKEKISEYRKQYYTANKDKTKTYNKEYHKENVDKRIEYVKIRKQNDPLFKLKERLRSSISYSLKRKGFTKKNRTHEILGCTFEEFKTYIEIKWEPWMSWNNYGKYNGQPNYGWDIDHIKPMASALNENDIIFLNHYKNLQPLCSYINRDVKKDK